MVLSGWMRHAVYSVFLLLVFIDHVVPEEGNKKDVYVNKIAVHISGGHDAATRVARSRGMHNIGQIGGLEDHYLFEIPHRQTRSADPSHDHHTYLKNHPEVHWFEQQVAKSRTKRDYLSVQAPSEDFKLDDPYYRQQWYLHGGGHGGFDMNVIPAWRKGYSGKNIVITILDDGIERTHPDLIRNYDPYASYDVNAQDNDPMPRYDATNENRHGTRCAGEVSAQANNSQCAVGIAYDSKIGGVRMLDGEVFDAVEAASLSFNRSHIHIYSASWGPDDDGRVVDGPGQLAKKAFENGIKLGREGKGSIFVWASGNGGSAQDSCNCDGYANSIYTLSISSTSEHGTKPWYLEECSSTLATTYSSGAYNEKQIVTVDLHGRCTVSHTGTSASAPLAAGIVALILEANPDLTWRDVQYITLMTSRPEPMTDGEWVTNALGRKVSLRYGYGLMDASAMVDLALQWRNVPEKHICLVPSSDDNESLTGERHVTTVTTDGCQGQATEVQFLEHVQCQVTLHFAPRGALAIHLTSPQGTRSTVLPRRPNDMSAQGFTDWPLLSVHFWGEDPRGDWTLEIENSGNPYNRELNGGNLVSWSLVLHGTKENPVHLKNETRALQAQPTEASIVRTTEKPTTPTPTTTTTKPTIPLQQCHEECEGTCTGTGPTHCLACKHFTNQTFGTCVPECQNGTYVHERMCKECDAACQTCSGPTLMECRTCHEGVKFHPKHNTCYEECLPGTYNGLVHCLPCFKDCKECAGPAKTECTVCKDGDQLSRGMCFSGQSWFTRMQESLQGVVLGMVLLCSLLFLVIGMVILLLARHQRRLCWAYRYDQLPCHDGEEEEGKVSLTYANGHDLDDNYKT